VEDFAGWLSQPERKLNSADERHRLGFVFVALHVDITDESAFARYAQDACGAVPNARQAMLDIAAEIGNYPPQLGLSQSTADRNADSQPINLGVLSGDPPCQLSNYLLGEVPFFSLHLLPLRR
jgi:hypothetical protein